MKRVVTNAVKRLLARAFAVGQRLGVDILPRHFYSEIPDLRKLRRTSDWRQPFSMIDVSGADPDQQLAFVRSLITDDIRRRIARGGIYATACARNGEPGYGPVEADILYAFVCTQRPQRIVQIGCGVSTAVCLLAASEAGYRPEMTCVEPYPNAFLRTATQTGEITLISKPVQTLDYGFLADLGPGDLFFVDSSHTLGPAGEVTRIVLEMLPRLAAGVRVHFHDIWFPYDYSGGILDGELFFWHETALLHAYLVGNRRARILASLSMLHYARRAELAQLIPTYRPRAEKDGVATGPGHYPSSIFLEVSDQEPRA
ncbi:MAG TPA: class I SAM-dependent methyltransferase [Gemmataceae bacterium]|nr:class I SAM-dependent methyltransferase [Gemmataceae bacterium]